jgi:hypothetical protein
MDRFSLSLQKKVAALSVFFLLVSGGASARVYEDIHLPDTFKCGEKNLPLQSAALRTFTWLRVRVYVVALYAEYRLTGLGDPQLGTRPICYELTFLRDVDNEDTDKAWEAQFKDSSMFPYPDLDKDIQFLKDKYGAIEGERKHVFALLPNDVTEIWENGKKKGEIKNDRFQKNFLSIWYGKKPPTEKVREDLIRGFLP